MKIKPKRAVRGFLKKNGFYIAVTAFVIAGAALSYAAVTTILKPKPELPVTPPAVEQPVTPSDAEPEAPPAVEPVPDDVVVEALQGADPLIPLYTRPVEGALQKPFSGDDLVRSETLGDWRTHNGADYVAAEGSEVFATYSGEIELAQADPFLGNIVRLKLDTGYSVLYGNLGPISGLRAGDRVSQGDVLGTVGKSAILENSEASHLHFELWSGDTALDPETLFAH
ncbi:MAG: M23 family metallopeptidase [Oscillospiraceae bacterium]